MMKYLNLYCDLCNELGQNKLYDINLSILFENGRISQDELEGLSDLVKVM